MAEYWWIDYALLAAGVVLWVFFEVRYRKKP
ncbi:hypothetical protein pSalSNUABM01_134 [Salmonella phage pSal-SNUABM-01]|nr:hypothetical protein pSalSNUABM01_134 [Salmonella phage pSal-SNUABM-01]